MSIVSEEDKNKEEESMIQMPGEVDEMDQDPQAPPHTPEQEEANNRNVLN
jgi:hypothetical protein